jgi:hypothetical protein
MFDLIGRLANRQQVGAGQTSDKPGQHIQDAPAPAKSFVPLHRAQARCSGGQERHASALLSIWDEQPRSLQRCAPPKKRRPRTSADARFDRAARSRRAAGTGRRLVLACGYFAQSAGEFRRFLRARCVAPVPSAPVLTPKARRLQAMRHATGN